MAEEESTKKTPWKNGYWYSYNERHVVQIVEGNSVKGNPHIILDFPDPPSLRCSISINTVLNANKTRNLLDYGYRCC